MAKKKPRKPKRVLRPLSDLPLKDAKRDLILTVKEADIKGAKRKDNDACAAANALCRQGHFKQAKVFKTTTYVQLRDGSWERFITPKALYMEIMIYDRGGRFEAGDFRLEAPKGIKRLGHHAKPRGSLGKTGKPSKTIHTIDNVRANAPKGRGAYENLLFG
jgi:hypothetical protein